ncbi:hypothetical protein TDIS_1269 [Thermosulfurimonas dismutans]|uniref:Uncharacterized protein n=1 Tax=Thermosulfurimonas dismutans TaxID=999894 RepID=A0A179D3J6_9BACT|nr:hypothetical protein TDIS_1269 [Thermosulfurimonas dismutans]
MPPTHRRKGFKPLLIIRVSPRRVLLVLLKKRSPEEKSCGGSM